MLIKNPQTFELEHRAYLLCGSKSMILAASSGGNITIVNLKDLSQLEFSLEKNILDISFSDSQNIVSFVEAESGNLFFADFQGNILSEEKPTNFESNLFETIDYKFIACYFDQYEEHFWCAILLTDYTVEIQLRQANGRSILDKIVVEDPFGDSHFTFHQTNKPNLIALWIAAGQDGQEIHWLKNINGKIFYQKDLTFSETTPPAFSPSGNEFLILDESNSVSRYKYPILKIGSCEWEDDDNNDLFGYYMGYVNENLALVASNEGRILFLDLNEMKITNELIIENHEPLPTHHYFPSLKESGICTDLNFFEKFENNFVFVYKRKSNAALKDWKDSIIVISADEILKRYSTNQ